MEYGWILGIVQGLIFIFVTYWMRVPPASGIAVATLGLLAIVMAIRAEDKWELPEKVIWLVIATCMMMVEIQAITHDRSKQDQDHIKDITEVGSRFDQISRLLQAVQAGINLKVDADAALMRESRRVQQTELKVRALNLSRDIAGVIIRAQLQEMAAVPPISRGVANWIAQQETIEGNAVAEYNFQFGASVKDVVAQLKKRGALGKITDCDGPRGTASPAMVSMLRFTYLNGCAQDLQLGASKLP